MTRQPTPGVHENFADKLSSPAPESHLEPVAWRFRWVYPATGEPTAWAETHDVRVARQKQADGWDVRPLYEHPPSPGSNMVEEPIGYLKPRQEWTIEPIFVYADERREWAKQIFTVPVYTGSPSPQSREDHKP